MKVLPKALNILVSHFSRLPGIGKKTAQRLAFFILKSDIEDIKLFSKALIDVKTRIIFCNVCGIMTEESPCSICDDYNRDDQIICIVEEPQDIFSFEKVDTYKGKYHVLGGVLSPLDGVGPDDLNLESLYKRIKKGMEVILAMNPSIEGDTTSLYLSNILENMDVKVTRLARGLPVGSNLEYMDELTLTRAIEGRTKV